MNVHCRTAARIAGVGAACSVLLAACDEPSTSPTPVPDQARGRPVTVPVTTPTGKPAAVAWSISPIAATFDQACYCTTYDMSIRAVNGLTSNPLWRVTWTVTLSVVPGDAGRGDPGTPGSAAAVDTGCTNAGKGVLSPVVDSSVYVGGAQGEDKFTWVHPDPHVIEPYACNHRSQGPHGHEGVITVVAVHGAQTCTVSYYGTHTGLSTDTTPSGHEQPGGPTCVST